MKRDMRNRMYCWVLILGRKLTYVPNAERTPTVCDDDFVLVLIISRACTFAPLANVANAFLHL